ncbi:hypothetical protein I0Q12_14380, partial [Rhodococcus sp. CX]|nr:hypothetical protein [Rhodococcus sp. CX]
MTTTADLRPATAAHPPTLDFVPVPDEIAVGGTWRRATGPAFSVVDPADGRVLQVVHQATAADVDDAVAAGRAAAADPA